ncbi:extracellular solute-binding protein [Candidatus Izemoplasma sp. B36]|uniref:sugar ABC transporter substrate-binding protein n=1 Tax=Candidatus Izemoplasma sp. B36 TaxID=3242468 RepID=UPI0035566469
MKKVMLSALLFLMVLFGAVSCGGNKELLIWVGAESVDFYAAKMVEYVEDYNATNEKEFPYEVSVVGVDSSTAAATFLDDTDAGADIFTVPHDNLGKLIAGSSAIAPVQSEALLTQIANDNPQSFLDVIKGTVDGTEYTFGIPYVAQSLVLYYNTAYITEEQALTWEGIWEAAQTANKNAMTLTEAGGFNNSFLLLATDATDHSTTLELYTDGVQENCYALGDDTIAKMKWGQRFFMDENGGKAPSDSGWEVELRDEKTLSTIGGAWHYEAATSALGEDLGITVLPTFTLTADDAYGTATEGTVYKSGTFADTKMFVIKKNSNKAEYLEDILLFLSSKEVQEESFEQAANLPAYKNASTEFEAFEADTLDAQLARAQVEMFAWGISQPFGYNSKYNTYYYSKGAPDLFLEILENEDGSFSTDQAIIDQLTIIQSLWTTGLRPE